MDNRDNKRFKLRLDLSEDLYDFKKDDLGIAALILLWLRLGLDNRGD
ncbi:MAG: hypothetical protein FWD01_01935 [Defluviitaleaceae bacterium]|nr:hypothetical protein [Defluviitaleaceae bacterium]